MSVPSRNINGFHYDKEFIERHQNPELPAEGTLHDNQYDMRIFQQLQHLRSCIDF